MSFGEVLKNLREERGVKQKEVANSCNLTPTCICQLESGSRNPTGSTIRELAKYFNCSADFLLELTDDFGSMIAAPTAPALSSDEQAILDLFRKMNRQQHVQLFAYCEGLLGAKAPSIRA